MYKDKHDTGASNSDPSGPVYADVDDVLERPTVDSPQPEESTEPGNVQQSDRIEHSTPAPELRRSSRVPIPNRKYMSYMLLTDGGEPEDYAEACQTVDANKVTPATVNSSTII
ncbi:hypothetical protein KIW84_022846 [Lathyrus oleraceus]|uniref:Uncharacterized protein n=1 Tax=Pisum sativum TaxID=3888 RepID=A0A9D5BAH0_PEA|nr:hypothetical protein KIW84_022846 [Pisum sativum]